MTIDGKTGAVVEHEKSLDKPVPAPASKEDPLRQLLDAYHRDPFRFIVGVTFGLASHLLRNATLPLIDQPQPKRRKRVARRIRR